jgi:hypothetical protein
MRVAAVLYEFFGFVHGARFRLLSLLHDNRAMKSAMRLADENYVLANTAVPKQGGLSCWPVYLNLDRRRPGVTPNREAKTFVK